MRKGLDYPVSIDSYESTRDRALKKIKNAAKDSSSEVLKDISEELDPKKRAERESNCQAVRMVIDKCLENYRDGEYTFPTTVKMITDAINRLK